MNIAVDRDVFLGLLTKAKLAIAAKSSLLVLHNFKIVINAKELTIGVTGSDLDVFISTTGALFEADETEDVMVQFLVKADALFSVVSNLAAGRIEIAVGDTDITIKSNDAFICRLSTLKTDDYPETPVDKECVEFPVDLESLKALTEVGGFAVSTDQTRACLCGVLFESTVAHCGTVSTDGHRLGQCIILLAGKTGKWILPIKTMRCAVRAMADETLRIMLSNKRVQITDGTTAVNSMLVEGSYPDYEKIIPKEFSKTAIMPRELLMAAVHRIAVVANAKTKLVKLVFAPTEVTVTAADMDIGAEATQVIRAEYTGEPMAMGFNATYLTEILNMLTTEQITMKMNTPTGVCVLAPNNVEEPKTTDLFLLMPLRIMDDSSK